MLPSGQGVLSSRTYVRSQHEGTLGDPLLQLAGGYFLCVFTWFSLCGYLGPDSLTEESVM